MDAGSDGCGRSRIGEQQRWPVRGKMTIRRGGTWTIGCSLHIGALRQLGVATVGSDDRGTSRHHVSSQVACDAGTCDC
jgi:hypothetical protein